MAFKFIKMTGAGNDFVLADNRSGQSSVDPERIIRLCDRRFGVGADGVLLVEPSENADFTMRYYNADGQEAEMCGNGARCIARYYIDHCLSGNSSGKREISFDTKAGLIRALMIGEQVQLQMMKPKDISQKNKIDLSTGTFEYGCADTGVPHAVFVTEDIENEPVNTLGREIRHHQNFAPRGTNVNWAQILGEDELRVRTYERGVESETLACGTGVVASAIIMHLSYGVKTPVKISVQGGRVLEVNFETKEDGIDNVTLTGPAEYVFEGKLL